MSSEANYLQIAINFQFYLYIICYFMIVKGE